MTSRNPVNLSSTNERPDQANATSWRIKAPKYAIYPDRSFAPKKVFVPP